MLSLWSQQASAALLAGLVTILSLVSALELVTGPQEAYSVVRDASTKPWFSSPRLSPA